MNGDNLLLSFFSHLKYIFIGLGAILGLFSLRYFKSTMIWIKGGIEDGDGKLENKELQIAFFSILAAFIVASIPFTHMYSEETITYPDSIIYCTFAGAGILYGINRAASAYESVNGKDKEEETKDHY